MNIPAWVPKLASVLMVLAGILIWAIRQEGRINAQEQAMETLKETCAALHKENRQQNGWLMKLVVLQLAPGSHMEPTGGKPR
jgi:hypothetical protein